MAESQRDLSFVVRALTDLARELQQPRNLDEILQRIVDTTAAVLGVERASFRLLDPSRSRLMAVARAGEPLHENPDTPFAMGEGLMGWIVERGEPLRSGDAQADERFAGRPGMRDPITSFVGVPLMAANTCLGVLSAVSPEPDRFTDDDEALAVLLATISSPHLEVARLSRLYNIDPLTGALNRQGLEEFLPQGTIVAPLSLVLVDVDNIKQVNDEHGHAIGDEVLRRVAGILAGIIRTGDAVVRFSGTIFLLVLAAVNAEAATRVAQRAREAVEKASLPIEEIDFALTISAGVAELRPNETRDDLIRRAEAAMHEAKQAGRNRVVVADA